MRSDEGASFPVTGADAFICTELSLYPRTAACYMPAAIRGYGLGRGLGDLGGGVATIAQTDR